MKAKERHLDTDRQGNDERDKERERNGGKRQTERQIETGKI